MTADMREALLPCPFCGGADIRSYPIRDGRAFACADCSGSVLAYEPDAYGKCLGKWNRREGAAWRRRAASAPTERVPREPTLAEIVQPVFETAQRIAEKKICDAAQEKP